MFAAVIGEILVVQLGKGEMIWLLRKMVSVIIGSSYHADICSSVHFSDQFGFN